MEEFLDILDEEGEKTGETASYSDVHARGLIHRAVHVWVVNPNNELLLQKRASTMEAYPNHWDISAAGHVSAGETSLEAAQRETREEIGLELPESAFEHLATLREHVILNEGTYISNEFQDVYLVRIPHGEAGLTLQRGEVAGVRWIAPDAFSTWSTGSGELLVPHREEYLKLLSAL